MNNVGERYRKVTLFVWVFYDSVFCIWGFFWGCIRYMCLCPSIPQTFRFIDWKKGSLEGKPPVKLFATWLGHKSHCFCGVFSGCVFVIQWNPMRVMFVETFRSPDRSWQYSDQFVIQLPWRTDSEIWILVKQDNYSFSSMNPFRIRERERENILLEPSHFGSRQPLWFEIF